VAGRVKVTIYAKGNGANIIEKHLMKYVDNGMWSLKLFGDYKGKYYTFNVNYRENYLGQTPGIYAKAVGVNGERGMIFNHVDCNPQGWKNHKKPDLLSPCDIVLYEVHVRDFTIHESSGSHSPGKYLGMVERGTINNAGLSTGIDHLKELGITHVHLMPVFDFDSVDESTPEIPQYNWGYDPANYNVPEGSYSSDPFHAEVRIREFKEMVMGFHENGIRVILDVVYNHTSITIGSIFNREVPEYYYRFNADGTYSNASGCKNETASERTMMRKFIIDSCIYWAKEYKIDGFRFDLMGIHDIETLNILSRELKSVDAGIFIYGEGWTADSSPLSESKRAVKMNTPELENIASFSNDIRDAVKGNVFDASAKGFITGEPGLEEVIKFGVAGSVYHPQVNYRACFSHKPWAPKPSQSVNYISCHDNLILADKLMKSAPDLSEEKMKRTYKLANAIILTCQGIPFIQAGVEFMRSKKFEHNSYNLPDEINGIDWDFKTSHQDVFQYIRKLIELRKAHPAFRMTSAEMIASHLEFFELKHTQNKVAFLLKDNANKDDWKDILVIYNATDENYCFILPQGNWNIAVKGSWVVPEGLSTISEQTDVPPVSMMILFR
jgi:pullulanase